jgi:hypothetical protein
MSQQKISDPWPFIYWKRSDSDLQLHSEGYKSTISSYGKGKKAFNFEIKDTLEKLLHIESSSLYPSSLNTMFNTQALPLLSKLLEYTPILRGGGESILNKFNHFFSLPFN